MQVQIPLLSEPITRAIFRIHGPFGIPTHNVDVVSGVPVAEFELPEGLDESIVEVLVVGIGNSGQPVGEPRVIVENSGHADDPGLDGADGEEGDEGPDDSGLANAYGSETEEEGDEGPDDSGLANAHGSEATEEVATSGFVALTEKNEVKLSDEVTASVISLSSELKLGENKDIISPFNDSEVVKHDGGFSNGPTKMGL